MNTIESIECGKDAKDPIYCMNCGKTFGIDSDAQYSQQHRVVVEKDGSLIITTVFSPLEEEGSDEESVEEIRERIEKEEPLPSPVEETNEFADLLNKTASSE